MSGFLLTQEFFFFLHNAINTFGKLQQRNPYMVLSPDCLVLCTTDHETQSHLFITCQYSDRFWKEITLAFRWFTTFPNEIGSFLIYTLNGHLFLDGKRHMDEFDSHFPIDHLEEAKQSTIQ